jgi:hypothetical protein
MASCVHGFILHGFMCAWLHVCIASCHVSIASFVHGIMCAWLHVRMALLHVCIASCLRGFILAVQYSCEAVQERKSRTDEYQRRG